MEQVVEGLLRLFHRQLLFVLTLDWKRRDLFSLLSNAVRKGQDDEEQRKKMRTALYRFTRDKAAAYECTACVPSETDLLARLYPFIEPLLVYGPDIVFRLAKETADGYDTADMKLRLRKMREWQKVFRQSYHALVSVHLKSDQEYERAESLLKAVTGAGVLGLHRRQVEIAQLKANHQDLESYISQSSPPFVSGRTDCIRLCNALNNSLTWLDVDIRANDRHDATHYTFTLRPLSRLVDEAVRTNPQLFDTLRIRRALFHQIHGCHDSQVRKEMMFAELAFSWIDQPMARRVGLDPELPHR